jgi:4-hydroxyphenylpyruvate dioxygenase-like putative hemolysin
MPSHPAPAPELLTALAGHVAIAARLFWDAQALIGSNAGKVEFAVLADAMRSLDHTIRTTAGPTAAAIAAASQDGWDACEAAHAELAEERRPGGHLRRVG